MPVNLHQHSLRRLCLGGVIAKGLPQPVAADSSLNFQRLILQDRKYRLPVAVLLGFAVSLLIETVQYHTGRGWFDAEDLFNNTLGAAIGSGLFCAADRIMGKRKAGRMACEVVSVLLILAGLVGCLQMKKLVGR
ncbi:MAG: VanZ family protein [Oscillospiraceae bacterium]|nr:VanZ family protein [Oscillospiraceae bacterium]